MAYILSIGSLNVSNCTNPSLASTSGSIVRKSGDPISSRYGIEINGVKYQKGTSLPIGTTSVSHTFTMSPSTVYTSRVYIYTTSYQYSSSLVRTSYSGLPAPVAASMSNILGNTADCNYSVSCGWTTCTARGVCWNTTGSPTTANSKTVDGSGLGSFTSYLTGLLPTTHYYVRAYATNSYGTTYSTTTLEFDTLTPPTVTTGLVTGATTSQIEISGEVTAGVSVTERGVCYATVTNPTISNSKVASGSGLGTFTSTLSSLTVNTIYFARAYATNAAGTSYGSIKTFYLPMGEFWISGFTSNGTLTIPAGYNHVEYLIVGGGGGGGNAKGSPPFATAGSGGGGGGGVLRGYAIVPETGGTYSVVVGAGGIANAGYGTSATGGQSSVFGIIAYGGGFGGVAGDITGIPIGSSGGDGASGGGGAGYETIDYTLGGDAIYGSQGNDGANGNSSFAAAGGGAGGAGSAGSSNTGGVGIASNISGALVTYGAGGNGASNGAAGTANTGMGGRGQASSSDLEYGGAGGSGIVYVGYGYMLESVVPELTTTAISDIGTTTATGGGNVISDGFAEITARGVCWATHTGATTSDSVYNNTGTLGSYVSYLTGLAEGVTYYVRAFATNSVGTAYGEEVSFTTLANPVVITSGVTQISLTTATSGGLVTSGTSVTARGVCWRTTINPTIANSKTVDGSGLGAFTSTLTGLVQNQTYYVRAYATNSLGTTYGANETINIPLYAPVLSGNTSASVDLSWTDANSEQEHYNIYKTTNCFPVNNLKGYYPFGKSPYSDTGKNFYGDYPDMTTSGLYSTGKIDKCTYFDTYNQVATIAGTAGQFERTDAFTYSMWISQGFLFSGYYNDGEFLIYNLSNGKGYSAWLEYVSGDTTVITGSTKIRYWFNLYFKIQSDTGTSIQAKVSNIPLIENFWYYLTLTYDGSSDNTGLKVYLDSVLQSSTNTGSALAATILSGTTNLLRFGNDAAPYTSPPPSNLFYGRLDEVGIWQTNLGQTDIDFLYASGTGYQYNPITELLATVDYPTQSYSDSGITIDCYYTYCVTAFLDSYTPDIESVCSNQYTAIVNGIVGASGLTATDILYTTCTLNWVNMNVSGVTGNYVQITTGTSYTTIATVASGATTYDVTGLTPNTTYYFRIVVYNDLQQAASSRCQVDTLDPSPFNLHATTVGLLLTDIAWELPSPIYSGISIEVRYKLIGSSVYTTAATLSVNDTTYRFLNLIAGETYDCYVVVIGSEYPSEVIQFTIPTFTLPPNFCSGINYTVTNADCGYNNGIITIPNQNYVYCYDFILEDYVGNSYTLTLNEFSGLSSQFYRLTANVKPAYYPFFSEFTCTFNWIPVETDGTTISITDIKVKNAVCGGFGGTRGRIIYQFTDSNTGATEWQFTLFNSLYQQVNYQSFTAITNIQYNAPPETYYGIIENNFGCKYLIEATFVDGEQLYTVTGIRRLFITKWTSLLAYNYYDSSSEDWYVAGIDTQQFTSSKIARYFVEDFWYEVKLDTASMSYGEVFQKNQNGLTYAETVTITIPKAENAKWKQLSNILTERYVVVFQDMHDQYWTCFYRNGAEVKSYSLNENQYVISLIHPSVNKMLTAIDYTYIKNAIL